MEKEVFCFPSEIAKFRLVLLHGLGADAEDLMHLGKELIDGISQSIELVSLKLIKSQMLSIFTEYKVDAIKIGLLCDLKLAKFIKDF